MRTSAFLAGAFALLAGATPGIQERGYKDCYNALLACPRKRDECSSFLRATVTPCPKTKTATVTAAATAFGTITSVYTTVTETIASTTTSTTTSTLTIQPKINIPIKRADPTCPSVSKPTKVPASVGKRCDKDTYATACRAIGVEAKTTTLPARTVTQTKTISTTYTSQETISVATTVTVTSVTTIEETVVVTETAAPGPEVCSYLALHSESFDGYLGASLTMGGWYATFASTKSEAKQWQLAGNNGDQLSIVGAIAFASTDNSGLLGASVKADTFRIFPTSSNSKLTCQFINRQLQCTSTATTGKSRTSAILCMVTSSGFTTKYIGFADTESLQTYQGTDYAVQCEDLTIEAELCTGN